MASSTASADVVSARSEPVGKSRRPRVKHKGALVALLGPFGVLFLIFYVAPFFYAVWQSFLKVEREGTFGAPTEVWGGLSQYTRVFEDQDFRESIFRVLLFGIVQVPIMLGLALAFALLLDSVALRGKKFFRLSFFVPYAVPGVIAAILWGNLYSPSLSPFKWLTENVDLLGGEWVLWSIANVTTWVFAGYNMLILYAALQSVPQEVYEAARIDGAKGFRTAWSIKIPLIMPAIILTGVFSIIGTLQLFTEPQVFRSITTSVSSTYTPNLAVYTTSTVPNFNLAAAFSVVLAVATFILSFVFLRLTQRRAFQ